MLALAGCGPGVSFRSGAHGGAAAISPDDAKRLMDEDRALLLIDVRDSAEWDSPNGHIDRARRIPFHELAGRLDEIAPWKDSTIVVVAEVGVRSHQAAEYLEAHGFKDARNLEGGMQAWRDAGY